MDDPDPEPLRQLEDEFSRLFQRLHLITKESAAHVSARLDPLGVAMMRWIAERPLLRTGELVDTFHLHKSTASRTLAELVELGYLQRLSDPSDGRVHRLQLTARGEEVVQQVRQHRSEQLATLLSGLSTAELSAAASLLRRLNDNLG